MCDAALRLPKNLKKVQKSLDKADDPRYNKSVPQAAERVSCKLNNERTKHQTGAHEDVQLKSLSTGVQSITRCLSRVYEAMENSSVK